MLRFATPSQLVICLILFFLPWIEIQCPMPDLNDMKFEPTGKKAAPPDLKKMSYTPLITQSGFQAASGGYTFADPMLRAQAEKGGKKEKDKDGPDAAPILWVYLLAVLAGIGIGFAMPSSRNRKSMLIGCCVMALLSAGGQAAMGFPIIKNIQEDAKKGGGLGGGGDMKLGPDDVLKTVYKFPFFLALLFCVGGIVTAAIEPTSGGKKGKKPVYDTDDDEDEDERPASRRKDKKRRDEDEEEEEEKPKNRGKKGDKDGGGSSGDPFKFD